MLGLLHQKKEWQDKEKMLLNQLWAALEEKLEHKSMLNEAKIALERIKGEWFIIVFFKVGFAESFELFPCRNFYIKKYRLF